MGVSLVQNVGVNATEIWGMAVSPRAGKDTKTRALPPSGLRARASFEGVLPNLTGFLLSSICYGFIEIIFKSPPIVSAFVCVNGGFQ